MGKKPKKGVTLGEIERMSEKYQPNIAWAVIIVLTCIFSLLWNSYAVWSIVLWTIAAVIGIFLPKYIEKCSLGLNRFVQKQEKVTKIALAVLGIVVAVFLSPAIFAILGFVTGMILAVHSTDLKEGFAQTKKKNAKKRKEHHEDQSSEDQVIMEEEDVIIEEDDEGKG